MAGFLSLSLGVKGSRPFSDGRTRLEDTPSRGNLSKESLGFWVIEPTVPKRNPRKVFSCFESVFLRGKSKIRF
jgi:hypothetical protein